MKICNSVIKLSQSPFKNMDTLKLQSLSNLKPSLEF